jgi:D-xylose 1-dehydrogenase (NADP+, D-xylono-1,5-lactone-forming)
MVRWGIISTARIARRIVEAAQIAPNAELVAVASRDEARGRAYASENGIARVHGSYEALLADPEVDAVYNPLPNSLHVPWSIKALEAGKHVLCEKPLSRDPEQVGAAFDAAERAGRLMMEAFMWRFQPQTEALERLCRDGTLGELRYARAQFGFNQPDPANVRWLKALEGGALMDVGCYCVSALRLVAGAEPERVSAELVEGGDGVDGRLAAVLRFPGDVLGTFDCGMDVHPRMGIEVVGSEATAFVPGPWFGVEPLILVTRGDAEPERIEPPAVHPYAVELEELSAAIEGGAPPRLGRADAVAQARAIDALYRAAESGRAVTLE